MRKRLVGLGLLAGLLLSLSASATQRSTRTILWKYDLDSATYIYCVFSPTDITGNGRIETSGSSATVTAVSGFTGPFANVAVGDEITATSNLLSTPITFTVVARASATSITADRAINLDVDGGTPFTIRNLSCGTSATDGWFSVPIGQNTLIITYAQGDLTGGVTYSIETRARGNYSEAVQADTGVIAATTALANSSMVVLGEQTQEWRVGLKYTTADTSDSTTNLEQINITLASEF
jgi:hypothetical protein